MFIRNSWYVIAESNEVATGSLLGRTVLNEHIVVMRTANGQLRAFTDACPHRFAPLSAGKVIDDCIQCPYHGSVYDADGHCVKVPGQSGAHGMDIGLQAYPLLERYGYLWIWMGTAQSCDDGASIPQWFDYADPGNPHWRGRADQFPAMPVYYELINDNLHDVSHVEFVHPETLGTTVIPEMYRMRDDEQRPDRYVRKTFDDTTLTVDFHAEDIQGGPVLHSMIAYQRGQQAWTDNVDWDLTLRYATPGYFLFNHRTKAVGEADAQAIQIASLHALTPETETSTHYFFYTANNLAADEQRCQEFTDICADALLFAFNQDKVLISGQMQRVPDGGRDSASLARVSFMGDSTPMLGRRMIARQRERE